MDLHEGNDLVDACVKDNLNLSDGNGNGNDGVIDLNMELDDVNDLVDKCVKEEKCIDLNMELDDNEDVDLGGYMKKENCVRDTRVEEQTDNVSVSDVSPVVNDDGDSGKTYTGRKRRKLGDFQKTGEESVLRRSARRQAKLSAEDDIASTVKYSGDDGGVPSDVSPVKKAGSARRQAKLSAKDDIVSTVKYNGDDGGLPSDVSPVIRARSARRQAKLSAKDDTVNAVINNGDDGGVLSDVSPVSYLRRSARRPAKLSVEDDIVNAVKNNGVSPEIRERSARRRSKLSAKDDVINVVNCNRDDSEVPPGASPVISAVSDEQPTVSGCEESEEPSRVIMNLELPPSTGNLNLEGLPVLDLFSVYAFLRSFSTVLFLSPFGLGDFVASIRSKSPNLLIDSIHVSLSRILRKRLEFQSSEGSTSAINCLRDLNWDLLDLITWPIFMAEYLLMKPGFDLSHWRLFKSDYHNQSEFVKVEILKYICDDVIESEAISSELNRRIMVGERTNAVNVNLKTKSVIDGTSDWNSDECCLCKMDGNLICCDGCPAAFHSKCVGIATNLLPEGDWFCPECVVDKSNPEIYVSQSIRGADLLGVDSHGRLYYSSCGYLLVSDNSDAETSFHYYHMNDLTAITNALNSSNGSYKAISNAITKYSRVYTKLIEEKTKSDSENISLELEKPLTHSAGSSELSEVVIGVQNTSKKRLRALKECSFVNRNHIDSSNSGYELSKTTIRKVGYLNLYSFARVASTVAKEWAPKLSHKTSQAPTKSLRELINVQMKTITKTSADFCWSNMKNLSVNARKEKCGWCLACKYPTDDGNCLFYMDNPTDLGNFTSEVLGFDSRITRNDRLIDVMCHILYIEDRLHGLLLGPWLSPHFPKLYRKSFLEASDIFTIKDLLLTLESNIWSRALSDDWLKQVDSVVTVGSASHFVASKLRANSRNVTGRKRSALDPETRSLKNALTGLVLFWWRGGRLTRKLFNWKGLPRALACKAARQGGGKKIDGITYPEHYDFPKRNKALVWRAFVESAVSVEQLALSIREFDANIKWEEIENTSHLAKMDKESIKSMRSFKKAIVRRKSSEGAVVKYLLDFGKRRFIPGTILKHGSKIEEASSERKKYWVEEPFVPLFLLKTFEDKRISLKSNKVRVSKLSNSRGVMKSSKKDVFSYLLAKTERSENYQCGLCNKDVLIRDAISCQYCEDFFHKRHVKKTSGGTYTCNKCYVGNTVTPKKWKSRSWKSKKVSKIIKKDGKGKQLVQQTKSKAFVVPLRRSARTPKVVTLQSKRKTVKKNKYGGKKKKSKVIVNELEKPKGKRGRPRKVKKSVRKKRSQMNATAYWLNGLLLSRKLNDERVKDFRVKNHLMASEHLDSVSSQPKCCLCDEPEFRSSLNYISCETCGGWYHGDAFGLKEEHIGVIISFKCHNCRERAPPICPHLHFASDKSGLGEEKEDDEGTKFGVEVSSEVLMKQNSGTIKQQKDMLNHDASPKQQNAENGPGSRKECAVDAQNGPESDKDHVEYVQNGPASNKDHVEENHAEDAQNGPEVDPVIEVGKGSLLTYSRTRVAVKQNGSSKAKESSTDPVD
ncbi:DDT domain-containing protein PTM-like [Rutidosis leptorrhynchoides]|uniref:DDT domain-containing protein PTM-like n=1 Tax=Rutidosis leptorrhynchoides TaxID=125765 RepID=UPI003A990536